MSQTLAENHREERDTSLLSLSWQGMDEIDGPYIKTYYAI